ncbi:glycosyltransferase family 39 protein [Candidatus Gottesmanbacteria bacterium]|nr:glycosyltransferase family 39 protein [Candidatus Gottesmanbacteria bacterium]
MIVLFFCFLLGLLLRIYLVITLPVWFDEKVALTLAQAPFIDVLLHSTDVARPPLYYLFIKFWSLLSSHYLWFRFSSLLLFSINFFLIYRVGKNINGELFGRIASILYSFSGYFIIFDWQIKPYTGLLTCILLVYWSMIQDKLNRGIFIFSVLVGLFFDFGFLYMFVPMFLYYVYLFLHKNREALFQVKMLTVCILIFLMFMAIFPKDFERFIRETSWVGSYMDIRFTLPFFFGVSGAPFAVMPPAILWCIGVIRSYVSDGFISIKNYLFFAGYFAFIIASIVSLVWIPIFHVRSLQIVGLCFLFGIAFALKEIYLRLSYGKFIVIVILSIMLLNVLRVSYLVPVSPGLFLISFSL